MARGADVPSQIKFFTHQAGRKIGVVSFWNLDSDMALFDPEAIRVAHHARVCLQVDYQIAFLMRDLRRRTREVAFEQFGVTGPQERELVRTNLTSCQ